MLNSESKHSYSDIFGGMVVGGGLVGLSVFLFGTKKGKEIQKELIKKYKHLRHRAEMSMKMLGHHKSRPKKNHRRVKLTKRRRKAHRSKSHFAKAA